MVKSVIRSTSYSCIHSKFHREHNIANFGGYTTILCTPIEWASISFFRRIGIKFLITLYRYKQAIFTPTTILLTKKTLFSGLFIVITVIAYMIVGTSHQRRAHLKPQGGQFVTCLLNISACVVLICVISVLSHEKVDYINIHVLTTSDCL